MKKTWMALLIGMALFLGACGSGEDSADQESVEKTEIETETGDTGEADSGTAGIDVEAAEAAYKQNCSSCHGGDLSGGMGPDLRQIGAKYEQAEILQIIHEGIGTMPPAPANEEEAQLIASWLAAKQ